jgi:hypothetical protein
LDETTNPFPLRTARDSKVAATPYTVEGTMMYTFPLPVLFVDIATPESQTAWDRLQAAVGDGLLTAVVDTPETQGAWPNTMEIHSHSSAEVADLVGARSALDLLVFVWRDLLDTVMNRRWDLTDNPYARMSVVQGAILLHEDTLGWMVDQHAADIAAGNALDRAHCVAIVPLPTSHHGLLAAAAQPIALAHGDILDAELTQAAIQEGHTGITPLAWRAEPVLQGHMDVVVV